MSCISSNFSSFFLDSLNDPSEFAKYLGNAENKIHTMEDIYTTNNGANVATSNGGSAYYGSGCGSGIGTGINISGSNGCDGELSDVPSAYNPHENHHQQQQNNHLHNHPHQQQQQQHNNTSSQPSHQHPHQQYNQQQTPQNYQQHQHHHHHHHHQDVGNISSFDGSFEFSKYLRHSEYGETTPPTNNLIDLDSSTPSNRSNNSVINVAAAVTSITATGNVADLDNFIDHDSKHIFDVHNSNESSGTGISLDHNNKTSSNTSECSDSSNQAGIIATTTTTTTIATTNSNTNSNSNVTTTNNNNNNNNSNSSSSSTSSTSSSSSSSKPLGKFVIRENFEVHPAHKVEEGIFQHMNKLPNKKKEQLKQIGVTFTGHMNISDKSIVVDNFARFCDEYGINDHRPFLTLNQSGMAKSEQIKFARYLGQGLPNFTLFCIYSNFKNLFCTKRFENYIKGSYNLHYILDKTKRFLTCTTSDLKNLTPQQICEGIDQIPSSNNNGLYKSDHHTKAIITNNTPPPPPTSQQISTNRPLLLEKLVVFENFDVHPSHRIEDGIFTHMNRLSPRKQELLKQFGILTNQNVTYQEKHTIIENFMKFCNEYKISDHRPFLDFHESGLPKMEQIKFVRYLGQGLPNLTLYKIYSSFKDLLALNRIEKLQSDGYNLEIILKKKKKNLLNRISAIACKERQERAAKAAAAAAAQAAAQAQAANLQNQYVQQPQIKLERITS